MEAKRKFDEEPRNWEGGKAGVPVVPVPSCSNVRPPLTDATQSFDDPGNRSFEKFKRSRMEAAGKGQIDRVRIDGDDNCKWVRDEPAEKIFPVHREQIAELYDGGVSNQPRKIDVPNLKVRPGNGKGGPVTCKIGAASAGGAAIVGALDFGFNVRTDKGNSMSLKMTEELARFLNQVSTMNFAIKVESRESGESLQVSLNGVRDNV